MGSDMVYRYRPMRVFPTMTTRLFMAVGSFMLGETLCLRNHSVNRQFAIILRVQRHFVAFGV